MPADIAPVAPATLSLDLSDESATTALFRAAVGPVGATHYLPVFARFELADRAGSGWNWAACLCTLGWMLFRRMWGPALVYAGVIAGATLIAAVLLGLVLQGPAQVQLGIGLALLLAVFVVPGVWGDAWLYAHCRKRMAEALARSSNWADAAALLDTQAPGRPRAWRVALACGLVLLAVVALLVAWLRVPASTAARPPGVEAPRVSASAPRPAASASASASAAASAPAPAPLATADSAPVAAASVAAAALPASTPVAVAAPPPPASAMGASSPKPAASGPAHAASAPALAAPAAALSTAPVSRPVEPVDAAYYVNVGLFAVPANARKAHARLQDAGVASRMQELPMKNGMRTRVRAGPYGTRAEAEAAAGKIRALGLDAVLFRQEPAAPP